LPGACGPLTAPDMDIEHVGTVRMHALPLPGIHCKALHHHGLILQQILAGYVRVVQVERVGRSRSRRPTRLRLDRNLQHHDWIGADVSISSICMIGRVLPQDSTVMPERRAPGVLRFEYTATQEHEQLITWMRMGSCGLSR